MNERVKRSHMRELAAWRREKYRNPELRHLFFELTEQCNERCLHCGSSCGSGSSPQVPSELLLAALADVKDRLGIERTQLCITGGEPLLRKDFFELMAAARGLGYKWGMTTNGTLVTPDVARKLTDCGMSTVSVSVDGLEATHDRFRGRKGSHVEALRGVRALAEQESFSHVQVTTVVHAWNFGELDALFEEMVELPIDSWRLAAIEPMGRALERPDLMLSPEEHRRLLEFVGDKRSEGWPVTYGCCHYLGTDFEREVRGAYFICSAGIYTASIMAKGDIGTCLDVARRPETICGNIYRDDFVDVWLNRFGFLRRELAELDSRCSDCEDREFCAGGSWHSFDFETHTQRVCLKGALL